MSADDTGTGPGQEEETRIVVILLTGPTADEMRTIGVCLVEERLAACVNVLPGASSIYRWRDSVEQSGEALAIVKTTAARMRVLEARVRELHSYEVPEILAIETAGGSGAYMDWIRDSVTKGSGDGAS